MKDIADKSIDAMILDPPYGIDYQSSRKIDKTKWKPKIENDLEPFIKWTNDAFRILKDKTPLLCFTRYDTEEIFRKALKESGFICKSQIIWDKEIHGMGDLKGDFAPRHENIIFATKGRFIFKKKRPVSVFRVQRVSPKKLLHPNEKPVKLIEELIESITIVNDIILDPFMGSGTTGIACLNTNRNFIGIEKSEEYFNLAKNRINDNIKKES